MNAGADDEAAEDALQQGSPFTAAQIMTRFREATGLSLVVRPPTDLRSIGFSRTISLEPGKKGTDRFGDFRFLVEIHPPDRPPRIGLGKRGLLRGRPSWQKVFPDRSHDPPFWSVSRHRGNVRLSVWGPEKRDVRKRYKALNAVLRSLKAR